MHIHIFPSGFDWGSFLGGVIGAIGAFLAAVAVFLMQSLPAKRRMRVELIIKLNRQMYTSRSDLQSVRNTTLSTVERACREIHEGLQELLPVASECHKKVFKMLVSLLNEMTEVLNGITAEERRNNNYMVTDLSVTRGNDILEQILHLLKQYH